MTRCSTGGNLILDPISHADVGGGDRVRDISDYRTLTAIVLSRVREMILGLELQPGQKISQEHLSLQLGVSRMPVREALKVLESEGLVKYLPTAALWSRKYPLRMWELGIIRQTEGTATEIAARNWIRTRSRELQRYLDEMDSLGIPPSDLDRYLSAHKAFHLTCAPRQIFRVSRNSSPRFGKQVKGTDGHVPSYLIGGKRQRGNTGRCLTPV